MAQLDPTALDLPAKRALTPGSIVRCRNRDWVLLPSGQGRDLYATQQWADGSSRWTACYWRAADGVMRVNFPRLCAVTGSHASSCTNR
jgi:hypothetical protein